MTVVAQAVAKVLPTALEAAKKLAQVFEKADLAEQFIPITDFAKSVADGGFANSVNFAKGLIPDLRSFMDSAGQYLSVEQKQLFDQVVEILESDNPNIADEDRRGILVTFESIISQTGGSTDIEAFPEVFEGTKTESNAGTNRVDGESAETNNESRSKGPEETADHAKNTTNTTNTNSGSKATGSIDEQAGEVVKTLVELFTGRVSLPNSFLNNGLKIAKAFGIKGIPEPKDLTKWVTEKVVDKSGLKEAVVNFIGGRDLGEVKVDNENDGFILGFIKNRALGFMKNALVRIKDTNPDELADGLSRGAFLFNNFGLGPAMSMISTLPLPRFLRTAIAWALPAIGRSIESFGELDQQERIRALHKMLNPRTNSSP